MSILTFFRTLPVNLQDGSFPELGLWGYILLGFLVAIEGPVATLLGSVAASAGIVKPLPVFLAAAVGNLTADTLWYSLGYLGKEEWLFHLGKLLRFRNDQINGLKKSMVEHSIKLLFFAKLTMTFMIPSLLAAGLVRIPLRKWLPAVFTGEIIWTGSLVLIGYYATEAVKRVEQGIEYLILLGSILFLITLFGFGRKIMQAQNKAS